jgi:hypothetical protein
VTRSKAKTVARGYGPAHKALRRRWAAEVARGDVYCARCGRLIFPGEPFDLGHDDFDRSRYNGPEHVRCNRATTTRKVRRRRRTYAAFVDAYGTTRVW